VRYLSVAASQEAPTPHATLAKNVAQSCQKLLFLDADGVLALDFLGEEFRRHGIDAALAEALPRAYRFVREAQLGYHGDHKLARRSDMLWAYFRSRAHVWGTEIESLANRLEGI